MGKQTYSIRSGSIPAVVNIEVAGHVVCQGILISEGKVEFDNFPLPESVVSAVQSYFKTLYSFGLDWLVKNYDGQAKCLVKSITVRATKTIPGTLVNVRTAAGKFSGWYVVSTHKIPEQYANGKSKHRICCKPINGREIISFEPWNVEKTPRTS